MSELVRVAPREIRDVVRRCCQVREIDAGVADQIGMAAMDAHLQGVPALDQVLDALQSNTLDTTFTVNTSTPTVASGQAETDVNPYRDGVEVDHHTWTELHAVAEAFLVSAELLDSFPE